MEVSFLQLTVRTKHQTQRKHSEALRREGSRHSQQRGQDTTDMFITLRLPEEAPAPAPELPRFRFEEPFGAPAKRSAAFGIREEAGDGPLTSPGEKSSTVAWLATRPLARIWRLAWLIPCEQRGESRNGDASGNGGGVEWEEGK